MSTVRPYWAKEALGRAVLAAALLLLTVLPGFGFASGVCPLEPAVAQAGQHHDGAPAPVGKTPGPECVLAAGCSLAATLAPAVPAKAPLLAVTVLRPGPPDDAAGPSRTVRPPLPPPRPSSASVALT
jgi:hypothetical protein